MGTKFPVALRIYWLFKWVVITPVILAFILTMTYNQYYPPSTRAYDGKTYVFPPWVLAVGWTVTLLPMMAALLGLLHQLYLSVSFSGGPGVHWSMMDWPSHQWFRTVEARKEIAVANIF